MFSFLKKQKDEEDGSERRREERYQKYYIARCEIGEKKSFSTVVDVSAVGAGIYISDKCPLGTKIRLVLQYEYEKGQYSSTPINLALEGKVVWIRETSPEEEFIDIKDARFRAGVELAKLNSKDKSTLSAILNNNK